MMDFFSLVTQIQNVQNSLQLQAAHAINIALTTRNWIIGFYIVEFEQKGDDRAAYGEKLLKNLENTLNSKGLEERRLREFRRFYQVYPHLRSEILAYLAPDDSIRHLLSAESDISMFQNEKWSMPPFKIFNRLSYTHLKRLISIDNPVKRAFYELETIKGCWSVSELERQISSLYFERSGLSQNKEALSALINQQAVQLSAKDVLNTPVSLEFLGLNNRALVTEEDLEQAILDDLQYFMLEMGRRICFEARQKRILIDDAYFFVDLVFYHRILKCHVIVELKVDKFRHEYASQLNLYLNYFKNEVLQSDDNPPIGILLCTHKGDTLVKYATAGLEEHLFVKKYLIQLPSEEDLKRYIAEELKRR